MWFLLVVALSTANGQDFLQDPIIYAPQVSEDEPVVAGEIRTNNGGAMVLTHTSVVAEVHAGLARVTFIQHFQNPYDEPLEAKYLFPLPTGAAIDRMDMTVGDRTIEGWVMERKAALEAYERAKEDGTRAALLEQERDNLFTQHISGICPGEGVQITLQYTEQIAYEDGLYELVIPTTVGERYSPPWVVDQERLTTPYAHTARHIDISIYLDEGLPIEAMFSDTHVIDIIDEGPWGGLIQLDPTDNVPNKDFSLSWALAGKQPRAAVLAHRPHADEPGYMAVSIEPQILSDIYVAQQRELLFVLDTSCSMAGEPLNMAKDAVMLSLAMMREDDTFNLVRFDSDASSLFHRPRANTAANIAAAKQWLKAPARGSTNMDAGIIHSLDMPGDPEALRLVLLLTDGFIGGERDMFAVVREHLGNARLFSMGIGGSVNRYLLEGLAEMGRGDVSYHTPNKSTEVTVNEFYDRIAHPGMTDIHLNWGDLEVTEQYPKRIPDLWAGQPIRVVARYDGSGPQTVTLTGRVGRENVVLRLPIDLPDRSVAHEGLAPMWARRKIRDIEWYPGTKSKAEVRQAVIDTALAHNMVSTYTSLVAIDDEPCACGKVAMQISVPHEPAPRAHNAFGVGGLGTKGMGSQKNRYGYGGGSLGGATMRGVAGRYSGRASTPIASAAGSPIIMGSIDSSLINQVIKNHLNSIKYCYEKGLRLDPDLAGKVSIRFEIAADGTVAHAKVKQTTLANPKVESCIVSRFRRMRFVPPSGNGTVWVNYPFIFRPQ